MISSERFWILVLAVVCFLAGAAAGVLWTLDRAPVQRPGPFATYEARLTREFGLDAGQRRDLRSILERYHADVEALKVRRIAGAEPELVRLGHLCRDRIRKWVLTPEQLARFDVLAEAAPTSL